MSDSVTETLSKQQERLAKIAADKEAAVATNTLTEEQGRTAKITALKEAASLNAALTPDTTTTTPTTQAVASNKIEVPKVTATGAASGTNANIGNIYKTAEDKINAISNTLPDNTKYTAPTAADLSATGFGVKDASTYYTPETTVAYQLSKILNSNSEYMKQVDAKSKLTANALGMLSSDRSIGAGVGAAIREGLPIATADAATMGKFALQQQQADNTLAGTSLEGLVSGQLQTQKGSIDTFLTKTQGAITSYINAAGAQANAELSVLNDRLNRETQMAVARLNASLNAGLLSQEYDLKTAQDTRNNATNLIGSTMVSIEQILRDPDMLQLGPEAVAATIKNMTDLMTSGIGLTYKMADLNTDKFVTDLTDFTSTSFNWQASSSTFDSTTYLKNKAAQLNASGSKQPNGQPWNTAAVQDAVAGAGLSLEAHAQKYGEIEGTWKPTA